MKTLAMLLLAISLCIQPGTGVTAEASGRDTAESGRCAPDSQEQVDLKARLR